MVRIMLPVFAFAADSFAIMYPVVKFEGGAFKMDDAKATATDPSALASKVAKGAGLLGADAKGLRYVAASPAKLVATFPSAKEGEVFNLTAVGWIADAATAKDIEGANASATADNRAEAEAPAAEGDAPVAPPNEATRPAPRQSRGRA